VEELICKKKNSLTLHSGNNTYHPKICILHADYLYDFPLILTINVQWEP